MGRLMKKFQRQSISVSAPPRMRPIAAPAPDMAAKMPIALLRSLPAGKVVVMRASAFGAASAPPRPCAARATSIVVSFCAMPAPSEARVKITTPHTNIRRRP